MTRLAVIGLGLIGGSAAAAARRAGMHVTGFDADPQHTRIALERGLVDTVASATADAARDADIVLLAVPVLAIVSLLAEIDPATPSQALILDAGSAKRAVVNAMESLAGAERMVGGHPLAGSERSGPDAADSHLFDRREWVLTRNERTGRRALDRAVDFVTVLGSHPLCVDAATHDRALAYTSHLPQLIASALVLARDDQPLELAGPAFAGMTRIAASDPGVWREILAANREEIVPALSAFQRVIGSILSDLSDGDVDAVVARIAEGRDSMAGDKVSS